MERLDAAGVREVRDDAAERAGRAAWMARCPFEGIDAGQLARLLRADAADSPKTVEKRVVFRRRYAAREGDDGAWAGFWKALLVLCDAALQGDAKASAALGAVGGDVAELIEGKDRAGLEETARDARARAERRRMNGGDDGFWRSVARACDVAAAKAALDEAQSAARTRRVRRAFGRHAANAAAADAATRRDCGRGDAATADAVTPRLRTRRQLRTRRNAAAAKAANFRRSTRPAPSEVT